MTSPFTQNCANFVPTRKPFEPPKDGKISALVCEEFQHTYIKCKVNSWIRWCVKLPIFISLKLLALLNEFSTTSVLNTAAYLLINQPTSIFRHSYDTKILHLFPVLKHFNSGWWENAFLIWKAGGLFEREKRKRLLNCSNYAHQLKNKLRFVESLQFEELYMLVRWRSTKWLLAQLKFEETQTEMHLKTMRVN